MSLSVTFTTTLNASEMNALAGKAFYCDHSSVLTLDVFLALTFYDSVNTWKSGEEKAI